MRPYGIDVLVFHPSPVATRFYDKARHAVHSVHAACCCCAPGAGPPVFVIALYLRSPAKLCYAALYCAALQAHKLDAMEFFKKFAVDPDELPDTGGGGGGGGLWWQWG